MNEVKTGWSNSRQIWYHLVTEAGGSKRAVLAMVSERERERERDDQK
jgi:heat shock protein HspQ